VADVVLRGRPGRVALHLADGPGGGGSGPALAPDTLELNLAAGPMAVRAAGRRRAAQQLQTLRIAPPCLCCVRPGIVFVWVQNAGRSALALKYACCGASLPVHQAG